MKLGLLDPVYGSITPSVHGFGLTFASCLAENIDSTDVIYIYIYIYAFLGVQYLSLYNEKVPYTKHL